MEQQITKSYDPQEHVEDYTILRIRKAYPSTGRWSVAMSPGKLPSMTTKKQEILQRAVELVGHVELAEQLNVPSWVVEAWSCGGLDMPDSKLMDLAVFLLESSRPRRAA